MTARQEAEMGVQTHTEKGQPKDQSTGATRSHVADLQPPDPTEVAQRWLSVAIGLAVLAIESLARSIVKTLEPEDEDAVELAAKEASGGPSLLPTLLGATLTVTVDSVRTGARLASNVGRRLGTMTSIATRQGIVQVPMERARNRVADLDARWRGERAENERIGSAFLGSIVPPMVNAALDQLDLTELVLARIDLDRMARAIDAEAIVRQVDLAGITNAVIEQLDLASIARQVIDEIDLPAIIRQSTGTMADETVEGIREQGVNADRAVSRLVDRLLGRDGGRREQEVLG
jgi:hypothetical protein